MIRRPPRSTQSRSSAASDVYKRQAQVLAHVRFGVAGLLPFSHSIAAQGYGAVPAGDTLDFSSHQARVVLIALHIAQAQAALHLSLIHISEPTRLGMIS